MISWPSALPLPQKKYNLTHSASSIRTRMESGRVRQRRRFTASQHAVSVEWLFTDDQFQLFESFVFHALDDGANWFEVNLVSGGGVTLHKARIVDGGFSGAKAHGDFWRVTASLDVEEVNTLSEEETVDQLYGVEKLKASLGDALSDYLPNS